MVKLIIGERSVVAIIILNTIALGAMAFTDPLLFEASTLHDTLHGPTGWAATKLGASIYEVARWADYGCVIYFIVETCLKIRVNGWRAYWASRWNRFDFTVVLLSAPVLLSPLLETHELGIVLVLRLGRLFRLFRVMVFIPNREHLYRGVMRALRASIGVFLALLLINVVLSLGATQLFGRIAPEYFGNPALSSYSLFRVFTVEGWHEIPETIAGRAHPTIAVLARLYFMGSVLVGGFLGVALANAVFVDEMTMDNNDELERKIDTLTDEVRALREEIRGERKS
jgi:voltage-gated sodium channel